MSDLGKPDKSYEEIEENLRSFLNALKQETNSVLVDYYRTAFSQMMVKNLWFMEKLKEEKNMSAEDILMEYLKDRMDEKIKDAVKDLDEAVKEAKARAEAAEAQNEKNTVNCIRVLMKGMNLNVQKAMDYMDIPVSDQSKYESLVMREN